MVVDKSDPRVGMHLYGRSYYIYAAYKGEAFYMVVRKRPQQYGREYYDVVHARHGTFSLLVQYMVDTYLRCDNYDELDADRGGHDDRFDDILVV